MVVFACLLSHAWHTVIPCPSATPAVLLGDFVVVGPRATTTEDRDRLREVLSASDAEVATLRTELEQARAATSEASAAAAAVAQAAAQAATATSRQEVQHLHCRVHAAREGRDGRGF